MGMPPLTYEKFTRMGELEVALYLGHHFPEPGTVGADVLEALASNLGLMDEGHLACAVVILGQHAPLRLLPAMPQLLADQRGAVWVNAHRMLYNFVPKDAVTPEMLQEYIACLRSHDVPSLSRMVADMIKSLRERFQR